MLPGEYDSVVKYNGSKPCIDDNIKFNEVCDKIESKYINKCIKFLFEK